MEDFEPKRQLEPKGLRVLPLQAQQPTSLSPATLRTSILQIQTLPKVKTRVKPLTKVEVKAKRDTAKVEANKGKEERVSTPLPAVYVPPAKRERQEITPPNTLTTSGL